MKGDTIGLCYTTFKKGETFGTKDNMEEGKSIPKIQKSTGKKPYKPICFNCHKLGHTANICRSKSNVVNGYKHNTYQGYKPRNFNGYCYTCKMHGHRVVECRNGANNPTTHMNQRSGSDWTRTFNDQRNPNW